MKQDWRCLEGMTLAEQVEHLKWKVEELTTAPEGFEALVEGLTPQQTRIVARLLQAPGKTVPFQAIWAAAFTHRTPDDEAADNIVKVQIYRIRRRLKADRQPLAIVNIHGIGYRAIVTDPSLLVKRNA